MLFHFQIVAVLSLLHGLFAQREILLFDDEGNECFTDIDLILLLDGSGTVGSEDFQKVKEWVKNMGRSLEIDRGFVQIGVIQYSYFYPTLPMDEQPYIHTEIKLGEHRNVVDFNDAVDGIQYQGFQTYTAHAINKTLEVDFSEFPPNRYPDAKRALILVTDGKADDWKDLPGVVKRAEDEFGVNMYAVGVGNYNETELNLIAHNRSARVFKLESFDDLAKVVGSLERDVHESCDCDQRGSLNNSCEFCTLQCFCKDYVEGRRCDRCFDDYYGIDSELGCFPCNCHPFGSTNSSCDQRTGQCDCVTTPQAYGRRCNQCGPLQYGQYPDCNDCDCNGFATSCNAETAECIDCRGGRIGVHCERCPNGHYFDNTGICVACECSGNIDPDDPESCDPFTGRCTKCLHNTTGESCEECKDTFFGNALTQSCQRCRCDLGGTDSSTCNGDDCTCEKRSGQCNCLANLMGRICGECTPEHWRAGLTEGCISCECSGTGSQPGTSCDQNTGSCVCKEEYVGRRCNDCAEGHEKIQGSDECRQIQTTTTTTTSEGTPPPPTPVTTSTTPRSTTTRRTLPVNPNWRPCTTCSRRWWPSYCQGWYCRRRWPYSQFYPSQRRCYSWNWSCRASVEYSYNQNYAQQYQPQSRSYMNTQFRRPRNYRGYFHHARNSRRPPVRYNLYRNN